MSKISEATKFTFSETNQEEIKKIFAKYPADRKKSATLPLLDLAQRQNGGWLSDDALNAVAELTEQPTIAVKSVATFYTMYHLDEVGENVVEVCKTLSCKLNGADKIQETIEKHLKIGLGETTGDKKFTLLPCECLGACVNAPIVKINDDFYEDLSDENIVEILDKLKNNEKPKTGSYKNRHSSEGIDDENSEEN